MTFAAYTRWYGAKRDAKRRAVIIHGRTTSSSGTRVEICLFASIEHCAGYLASSEAEAPMWSSSSTGIIEEFIANKGARPADLYDDDESISVEILRTIQQTADSIDQELSAVTLGIGRYKDLDESKALVLFTEQVEYLKVEQRKRQQQLEQPSAGRDATQ